MHMNLTLTLTPETEARLKEQAARVGKAPESVALEALEEKLSIEEPPAATLPPDEWRARFNALLASLPRTEATFVDDSRESIYDGRGE
jgi:predicted DNA-binding protein